ncbi:hypothetical protein M407DRAFT_204418 [Tulasnella calospora MUT 4182]|uniref:Uncharacterized protein n=1 Tax=Tulasnella calospora MUT 4182 TaxID=1051891 RepID=A0A0C3QKK2_9AGAM|nr:hypothetical protein M407DRAFT_204418 [Tulasnella calospora MUT 4182]
MVLKLYPGFPPDFLKYLSSEAGWSFLCPQRLMTRLRHTCSWFGWRDVSPFSSSLAWKQAAVP